MQRLSGLDAMLLWADMHMGGLMILDSSGSPEFGFEQYRKFLHERVPLALPLRRRVQNVPFGIDRPIWVDDRDFDPDRHLEQATVRAPGGMDDVAALVSELFSRGLDLAHPPWKVWFIEGLADGRTAVFMKMHHAMFDGMGGLGLTGVLMDTEPDAPPPSPPDLDAVEPERSAIELVARGVVNLAGSVPRSAQFGVQTTRKLLTLAQLMLRKHAVPMPWSTPRVPFNGRVGSRMSHAFASLPLQDVKEIKNALGVTVNDVMLAVAAGALRTHLLEREALPDRPLMATVPVSIRSEAEADRVGNLTSGMTVALPTDVADPVERVFAVRRAAQGAKEQTSALRAQHVTDFTDVLWPPVLAGAVRVMDRMSAFKPMSNIPISNVPGPAQRLYCAGMPVEHMFPTPPLMFGWGILLILGSYGDLLELGLATDPDLAGDARRIADGMRASFDELRAAVTPTRGR